MRKWVMVATVVAAAVLAGDAASSDLAPTSVCPTWSGTQMRCLHNYTRAQHGLTALQPSPALFAAATRKADDDETSAIFSHDPYGYPTIRTAYQGWLASPGHYANIVNPAYRWYGSSYRAFGPLPRFWAVDLAG